MMTTMDFDLTAIPREFPQFGKSVWNLRRTREEVFGGEGSKCGDRGSQAGKCADTSCGCADCGCGGLPSGCRRIQERIEPWFRPQASGSHKEISLKNRLMLLDRNGLISELATTVRRLKKVIEVEDLQSIEVATKKMIGRQNEFSELVSQDMVTAILEYAKSILDGKARVASRHIHDIDIVGRVMSGHMSFSEIMAKIDAVTGVLVEESPGPLCAELLTGVGGGASYSCAPTGCAAAALARGYDGGACSILPGGHPDAWVHPGCTCRFYKLLKRDVPWWLPWALLLALILALLSGGAAAPVLAAAGLGIMFDIIWTDSGGSAGSGGPPIL